jgi:hypothetical protein
MRQHLRYDYEGSAYDLAHRLVVVPRQRHGNQRRLHHSLTVSAEAADVTTRRDWHGNLVTDVRLGVVPATVEFALQALIERRGASTGATLPLSALTELRLLRPTKLTTADAALQQVARELRAAAPTTSTSPSSAAPTSTARSPTSTARRRCRPRRRRPTPAGAVSARTTRT